MVAKAKTASPLGNQVLVELLDAGEAAGTQIILDKEVKLDTPQGYVLSVGSMVPDSFGLNVGDRVFLSTGNAVFPPLYRPEGRKQVCVDYMTIKGKLHEEKE